MATQKTWAGIIEAIDETLCDVTTTGTFATGGKLPTMPLPGLEVAPVGPIAFPLLPIQAQALHAASEPAPFGRGIDTVVDPKVRNARQIDAARVRTSRPWDAAMSDLVKQVTAALGGIEGCVVPHLYKLVLYEAGGFFKAHQDTEKEPRMFATLVVQLPAGHEGGGLVVRHCGATKQFQFAAGSAVEYFFAAFFTDCEHELQEVTAGHRLCLLYNLVRTDAGACPRPISNHEAARAVAEEAKRWAAEPTLGRRKLLVPLEHKYTETNLSAAGLKGRDRAVVDMLSASGAFVVHLALVEKHVVGSTECGGYCSRKRKWYGSDSEDSEDGDPDDYDMDDVHDETVELKCWTALDGTPSGFDPVSMDNVDEILGGDPFEDATPDKREYEGYTGNAGPTLDYWYHCAVAVVWPTQNAVSMACSTGFAGAVRWAQKLVATGSPDAAPVLTEVVAFAGSHPTRTQSYLPELLAVATAAKHEACALRTLGLMARPSVGLQSSASAAAAADVVFAFGWAPLGDAVPDVVRASSCAHAQHCAGLALALQAKGLVEAAGAVGQATMGAVLASRDLTPAFLPPKVVGSGRCQFLVTGPGGGRPASEPVATALLEMLFVVRTGCHSQRSQFLARASALPPAVLAAGLAAVRGPITDALRDGDATVRPPFEALVRCFLATGLASDRPLATPADATQVLELLLWYAEPVLLHAFQDAAAGLPAASSGPILQAALCSPAVRAAIAHPAIRSLASARAEQLCYDPPPRTWQQPQASVPGHPSVTAFLRGPNQRFVAEGFNGIAHARNFARKHFAGQYNAAEGHSADAVPLGTGRRARVEITKTLHAHNARLQQHTRDQKEREGLLDLLSGGDDCKPVAN